MMYSQQSVAATVAICALMCAVQAKNWDTYPDTAKRDNEQERVRRQSDNSTEFFTDQTSCNPATYTEYDVLRRRDSGLLAQPQNQMRCGNCWAFGTVNTLTDDLSLRSRTRQPLLSAGFIASCAKQGVANMNGCCGAYLYAGPRFLIQTGDVTNVCFPYSGIFTKNTLPTCPRRCNNRQPVDPSTYRTMSYRYLPSDQSIINALVGGSTVLVQMGVTNEFYGYSCGVFQQSPPWKYVGYHAIEIVDYGTLPSGTQFWVVKNSWGTGWGEFGYFRIRRGDLNIGLRAIQLILGSASSQPDDSNPGPFLGGEEPVANATNDERVMAHVNFVLQYSVNGEMLSCSDGTTATEVDPESVELTGAYTQVVAGIRVRAEFKVNVTGCTVQYRASINASTITDLDGGLSLESFNSNMNASSAKMFAIGFWALVLFSTFIAFISTN